MDTTTNSDMDLSRVSVGESDEAGLSQQQVQGINCSIVRLVSKVRKYTILTQLHMGLPHKSADVRPIMVEFYQFEETQMIMDIREEFDMFYVFGSTDKTVMRNVSTLRDYFEYAVGYVTEHMQGITGLNDKNFVEVLDTFTDKLQLLSTTIATKSIFDDKFRIG